MKTTKKNRVILFVFMLAVCCIALFSNPLKWPDAWIQSYVLNITPLGSKFDDVVKIIKDKNWDIFYIHKDKGFYDQREHSRKSVGSMSIRASLGDYQGIPFKTNVTVFWGFNVDGKLIDIWVWKTRNGL